MKETAVYIGVGTLILIIVVILGLMGWIFFKLIRALARIQMPQRP